MERRRTPAEIREEFERLQREREERRLQQRTNPKVSQGPGFMRTPHEKALYPEARSEIMRCWWIVKGKTYKLVGQNLAYIMSKSYLSGNTSLAAISHAAAHLQEMNVLYHVEGRQNQSPVFSRSQGVLPSRYTGQSLKAISSDCAAQVLDAGNQRTVAGQRTAT